ncbi:hypothetical protein SAMN05216603_103178 [Pseudomonas benzenivorans]|nr:hypothetical protein [Pseudomonas benzenivorans]SDG72245.1 hypothetical protein SAMN05216603_103178 [Pseudomonas benzenivorans]
MDPRYHSEEASNELLLTCSALREVGLDQEADLFREAVFDRQYVDLALQVLRMRVHHASPDDGQSANQTAHRLLERLNRLLA